VELENEREGTEVNLCTPFETLPVGIKSSPAGGRRLYPFRGKVSGVTMENASGEAACFESGVLIFVGNDCGGRLSFGTVKDRMSCGSGIF
jgi:hypothetical protein